MLSCSGFSSLRRDVERDVQAPYGMQSCRIRNTLGEPLLALLACCPAWPWLTTWPDAPPGLASPALLPLPLTWIWTLTFHSAPVRSAAVGCLRLPMAPRPVHAAAHHTTPETDYPNETTWRAGSQSRGQAKNPYAAGAGRRPGQEPHS